MIKNVLKTGMVLGLALCSTLAISQSNDSRTGKSTVDSRNTPVDQVITLKDLVESHNQNAAARSATEGFEGEFLPQCWTSIDADGDGEDWFQYAAAGSAYEGSFSAASASWFGGTILNPDNYLVSPQFTVGDDMMLTYYVGAQDPLYPEENYGVYVSTTGNAEADFTTELFTEVLEDGEWHERQVDLTDYDGQDIYIAFRHYGVSDQFYMKLDQITLPGDFVNSECIGCTQVQYPSIVSNSVVCVDGTDGWFYEIEFSDAGSANFTLSNSANSDTQTITEAGTVTAGPFTNGEEVTLTITSDEFTDCAIGLAVSGNCTDPCTSYAGDPYDVFDEVPAPDNEGNCELIVFEEFEIWQNEAYILNGLTADVTYTFAACTGPGAGSWDVVYSVLDASENVVASGTDMDGCSITWVAPTNGNYIVTVNRVGECGIANNIDNGFPSITCSGVVGVSEKAQVDAKFYPNPATDEIRVLTSLEGAATVRIFDAVGRLVSENNLSLSGSEFVQNISNLENGMYTMQISTTDKVATERFIKQ